MGIDEQIKQENEAIDRIRKRVAHKINNRDDAIRLRDEAEKLRDKKLARLRDLGSGASEDHREQLADAIESLEAQSDRLTDVEDTLANALVRLRNRIGPRRKAIKRLRAKREEIQNRQGQLSPHFFDAEFHCRDGTKYPASHRPELKVWCHKVLEPMRAKFGSCHVNSGHRSRPYNMRIGGASASFHIWNEHPGDVATDLSFERGTVTEWRAYARQLAEVHGIGFYPAGHFVHVDSGPEREWSGP